MATYLVLNTLTEQGARDIRNFPHIAAGIRNEVEGRGGRLLGMYLTQGRYDTVLWIDMPDEQQFVAGLLSALGLGAIHSETLRAFDEWEMREIIEKMSEGPAVRATAGAAS